MEPTARRVVIESVQPAVDCGRFPAKRTAGEETTVEAKVFADGHDAVEARLQYRKTDAGKWSEAPMQPLGNDSWRSSFTPDTPGDWEFRIEAWIDHFGSWVKGLHKRSEAGAVTEIDMAIGAQLVSLAAKRSKGKKASNLAAEAEKLADEGTSLGYRVELALSTGLSESMSDLADRSLSTISDVFAVIADRRQAVFSSWYEFFPRSLGEVGEHGTFADVEAHLDYVAAMGFDVVYLPPIHPIGNAHRKGPNNTLHAGPDDPGVPWAIGSQQGGHDSIHPDLGSMEDFRSMVRAGAERGLEFALDVAFQASPDHPWVEEHPEWFKSRPDGTIQYAENPPKKYQDIYPIDFETSDPDGLWKGLKSVFDFWIDEGVEIFRVDNPHTKSFPFWEWLVTEIRAAHPGVVFLAEAFTRPAVMHRLAKVGFNQSYTYFAWRNTRHELVEYMQDLHEVADFFRPNFWPNTPDILTEYLQTGTRAAFISRLVLASTLSASYGIYGPAYELMEHRPIRPGAEEYLDSEKYQIRDWDLDRADSLAPLITQVNRARREHPALQRNHNLHFHDVDNEMILCYSKRHGPDVVLIIVNLDPHHTQSGWTSLDLDALGLDGVGQFQMHDLLTERRYVWGGSRNFVRLDVEGVPAHVFHVRSPSRSERDFDYFN